MARPRKDTNTNNLPARIPARLREVAAVCAILSDEQAREKIKGIIHKHIINSDTIQNNIIKIASADPQDDNGITPKDIIAAAKEHNQIIGVAGCHASGNVFVNNLYQQNNIVAADPGVVNTLRSVIEHMADIDVPEAEIEPKR